MQIMEMTRQIQAIHIRNGTRTPRSETVVQEETLCLYLNGDLLVRLLCSPCHLEDLAVGFLFSEGVVSRLEDVLEMIVGDLDSKRFETKRYHMLAPDKIRISGRLAIDRFNEVFTSDLTDQFSVTVGGFLMHKLGRIPRRGETIKFNDLIFEVILARKTGWMR